MTSAAEIFSAVRLPHDWERVKETDPGYCWLALYDTPWQQHAAYALGERAFRPRPSDLATLNGRSKTRCVIGRDGAGNTTHLMSVPCGILACDYPLDGKKRFGEDVRPYSIFWFWLAFVVLYMAVDDFPNAWVIMGSGVASWFFSVMGPAGEREPGSPRGGPSDSGGRAAYARRVAKANANAKTPPRPPERPATPRPVFGPEQKASVTGVPENPTTPIKEKPIASASPPLSTSVLRELSPGTEKAVVEAGSPTAQSDDLPELVTSDAADSDDTTDDDAKHDGGPPPSGLRQPKFGKVTIMDPVGIEAEVVKEKRAKPGSARKVARTAKPAAVKPGRGGFLRRSNRGTVALIAMALLGVASGFDVPTVWQEMVPLIAEGSDMGTMAANFADMHRTVLSVWQPSAEDSFSVCVTTASARWELLSWTKQESLIWHYVYVMCPQSHEGDASMQPSRLQSLKRGAYVARRDDIGANGRGGLYGADPTSVSAGDLLDEGLSAGVTRVKRGVLELLSTAGPAFDGVYADVTRVLKTAEYAKKAAIKAVDDYGRGATDAVESQLRKVVDRVNESAVTPASILDYLTPRLGIVANSVDKAINATASLVNRTADSTYNVTPSVESVVDGAAAVIGSVAKFAAKRITGLAKLLDDITDGADAVAAEIIRQSDPAAVIAKKILGNMTWHLNALQDKYWWAANLTNNTVSYWIYEVEYAKQPGRFISSLPILAGDIGSTINNVTKQAVKDLELLKAPGEVIKHAREGALGAGWALNWLDKGPDKWGWPSLPIFHLFNWNWNNVGGESPAGKDGKEKVEREEKRSGED